MTPQEYEQYIASIFQERGYETIVTPQSGDWGIDVIATKGNEKIAIQAKMYGHTSRKVNRATIMQLHGAMAFEKCTKAVLATDGEILEDALAVAKALNIEIMQTSPTLKTKSQQKHCEKESTKHICNDNYPTFDEIWQKYIMPLKGKTLSNSKGDNRIIDVNWSGITRLTSTGNCGKIDIEGFRFAYNELILKGTVTRDYINQQIDKRCSSGIVLILGQIPFVSTEVKPKLALRVLKDLIPHK